jgi:C4-dicarboxylate-specific signal transduction histidine kinase
VRGRSGDARWDDPDLASADVQSQRLKRAVPVHVDFAAGRYTLVYATAAGSHAARIDLRDAVPWDEWPVDPKTSPVRVTLEYEGQRYVLQPGAANDGPWHYDFSKPLSAASQPFEVIAFRTADWRDLPWWQMIAWTVLCFGIAFAVLEMQAQRARRRRAEELLRLGQVSRLGALGELAAGMAHELNQPLTALLANTQAANRLLADEPPDIATAREAMSRTVEQARRASDVVGRLRRAVERPERKVEARAVDLAQAARDVLYLLEPESAGRQVTPAVHGSDVKVRADPVALEQIVHNLVTNALQALDRVDAATRRLAVEVTKAEGYGVLTVSDSGPGIPPEVLPRVFEPFFTTRAGGLGLGLSLCESLAVDMGGSLAAANAASGGAVFTLRLPLAESP